MMTTNTIAESGPLVGDDISDTSDAVTLRSAPDIALPLESEPSLQSELGLPAASSQEISKEAGPNAVDSLNGNPSKAIVMAAAAGLLLGAIVKKSLPAVRR